MKYAVDSTIGFDEGGSAEFYDILQYTTLGFKQFKNKKTASDTFAKQKILSRYNLAPKIIGKICRLPIFIDGIDYITNIITTIITTIFRSIHST